MPLRRRFRCDNCGVPMETIMLSVGESAWCEECCHYTRVPAIDDPTTPDPPDDRLPLPEEQEWLIDAMSDLVRARGWENFIASPVLEPTPEYFPDPWTGNEGGAWNVTRRLMAYAGLSDYSAKLYLDYSPQPGCAGDAAFYAGREGNECHFGVMVERLTDCDLFVAAMAHEVAHAYRDVHGLRTQDRDEEELLTDLTTVYLGFGIITTNATYQYRQSGSFEGGRATLRSSHAQLGYLPPQAMAYLLGLQAVIRGWSKGRLGTTRQFLEANQQTFLTRAVEVLSAIKGEMYTRLHLPEFERWPEEKLPTDIKSTEIGSPRVVTIGLETWDERELDQPSASPDHRSLILPYLVIGGALGAFAGLAAMSITRTWYPVYIGMGLGAVMGAAFGAHKSGDYCPRVTCGVKLHRGTNSCPACGVVLGSSIQQNENTS